jgi:hypothetical protein
MTAAGCLLSHAGSWNQMLMGEAAGFLWLRHRIEWLGHDVCPQGVATSLMLTV